MRSSSHVWFGPVPPVRRDLLNYYHGGKPGSGPGGSAVSPAPVLRPVSQASSSQPGPAAKLGLAEAEPLPVSVSCAAGTSARSANSAEMDSSRSATNQPGQSDAW